MFRTTSNRRLFAGLAALTLAALPAFAHAEELERVHVNGRVVEATPRYDVHAACASLDEQLGKALLRTWLETSHYGEVKVQFVVENGRVEATSATGISADVARKVRSAMRRVDCSQQAEGVQVYRFSVNFVNPNAPEDRSETRTAGAARLRING